MDLIQDLQKICSKNRVKSRLVDIHSYARDASLYRLIPRVVVQPRDENEVIDLLKYARKKNRGLTFRAAGTSLSGQSISDSILVEINKYWKKYSVSNSGEKITLEPGIVGDHANQYLAPFNRIIGPDPASMNSCFIGGIVANNASGMSAGVKYNSAKTVQSMRIILFNGTILDSSDPNCDDHMKSSIPEIHRGLLDLKQKIMQNEQLVHRIKEKFTRKNTTGYALNAFIEYEKPIDILMHLMVGSEGTLGFISNITFNTFPDKPYKSAALLFFNSINQAAESVFPLKETAPSSLEIMDRAALRSVENEPGMPDEIKHLSDSAAAILCEYQATTKSELESKIKSGREILKNLSLVYPADFTTDEQKRLLFWKVRKGMFPSVGAMRKPGTTVLIEDVGFRIKDLAPAILDLQQLFKKHGYEDAIIFGHSEAGNIHFIISQEFSSEQGINQYRRFMSDVVKLVIEKYDGALKTEHGTGRNMAPFVQQEWGSEAYNIMCKLKSLLDPDNILNPDVIISRDPELHLKNIKPTPAVHEVVDKCIECGFCEIWCPSRDLTMTPRRRIATLREISLLKQGNYNQKQNSKVLEKQYGFECVDTCAVDGLCAMGCPVKIDTGNLVRFFRQQHHHPLSNSIAQWTVNHFSFVVQMVRMMLNIASVFTKMIGQKNFTYLSRKVHILSKTKIPAWNLYMPAGAKRLPKLKVKEEKNLIIYFPSCLSRSMGRIKAEKNISVPEMMTYISEQANIKLQYPENINELCCGTPYSSKGFHSAFLSMMEKTITSLYKTSNSGQHPIVMDTSPCSYKIKQYGAFINNSELMNKYTRLKILDIIEYLHDYILPNIKLTRLPEKIILHPTCSNIKMENVHKMMTIAQACTNQVILPTHHGCCGFAGDRGFLIPALTESATRAEADQVLQIPDSSGHYSTSRTCEIGMSSATRHTYSSILRLLYKAITIADTNTNYHNNIVRDSK